MNFLLASLWRADAPASILQMTMDSIALCYLLPCYRRVSTPELMVANSAEDKLKDLKTASRSTTESSNISLSSRLSAYRKESGNRWPDCAKAYDELVERLNVLDRGEIGPRLGQTMPEFNLPDEEGRLVSLSSLLRSGLAVISINRGHWCPYCKLELRSLAAINDEIERVGARVVSIMPDRAQFTRSYVAQSGLPFPVLSDIDLGYSLSLGLIFWVGAEVRQLYEEAGVELEKYQGNQGYFLPMAAKFIVGRDGLVKARQVNIEFRERMEPKAIITALRELRANEQTTQRLLRYSSSLSEPSADDISVTSQKSAVS